MIKKTAFIFAHNPTSSRKKFQHSKFINCFSWVAEASSSFVVDSSARQEKTLFKMLDIDGFVGQVVLIHSTWKIDGLVLKPLWIWHGAASFVLSNWSTIPSTVSCLDCILYVCVICICIQVSPKFEDNKIAA